MDMCLENKVLPSDRQVLENLTTIIANNNKRTSDNTHWWIWPSGQSDSLLKEGE